MWFFLACTPETPLDTGDTALDTGADPNAASYCEEISASVVADPSVAESGFDFAAGEVIDDNAGSWYGTFTYATTGTDSGMMGLTYGGGEILAVVQTLVNPGGDDTGPAMGAPDPNCPSFYRIPLVVQLRVGDGVLDESTAVNLEAITADAPSLDLTLPVEDLVGEAAPSWDTREWATNTLYASGYRADGRWNVSVGFWGSNESSSRKASPKEEAETGTVDVSGVSETLGSMLLDLDDG